MFEEHVGWSKEFISSWIFSLLVPGSHMMILQYLPTILLAILHVSSTGTHNSAFGLRRTSNLGE